MVNTRTGDQENPRETATYPQITQVALPEEIAAACPLLAEVGRCYAHPPLFTVADGADFRDGLPGLGTKNLFLKDKKDRLWLVTAAQDSRIDLTALAGWLRARHLAASRLSFASAERLFQVLGVTPGSVTPLALMNDAARQVGVIIDAALISADEISCHPLRNDMTVVFPPAVLRRILDQWGYQPVVIDFSGPELTSMVL